MAKKKRTKRRAAPRGKKWKWPLFIFLSAALAVLIYFSYRVFGPNTTSFGDHKYFYIHSNATYGSTLRALKEQGIVKHIRSFEWLARKLDYPRHVHPGKYEIKPGMSNLEIIRLLRSGRQTPVRLVITKVRTKADFAALISRSLEPDSVTVMALLHDNVYLRQYGLDSNSALCAVIPNTYEFFWNTSAEDVFKRLENEKERFWNDKRKAEAEAIGLTPKQVYIMASIIEEETNKTKDKRLIASVYLNRMHAGMRLMADPTVKFALGDFSLRRIFHKQTAYSSPYNTYQNSGLPPGPICTPSINTLDAVLQAPETGYYYFCAKADFSGYSVFASTLGEHMRNARAYQKALDSLNIR